MSGPVGALMLVLLWLAVACLASGGVAVAAGVLAHRERATNAAVWSRAGMAFATAMGLLVAVGGVVLLALQDV